MRFKSALELKHKKEKVNNKDKLTLFLAETLQLEDDTILKLCIGLMENNTKHFDIKIIFFDREIKKAHA